MATGICEKCAQLLKDFVAYVKRLRSELVQKITECIKNLSRCSCLRRKRATVASDISEQHERQAARTLLDHLDTVDYPLPVALLEPYTALLLSNDIEVQRITTLSLVHLLVNNKVSKEQVIETGMLMPLLEMLQSGDPTVQCNSCQCIASLASSDSNREAIVSAEGVIPLLVLAKSYDPQVQQNAVWALLNLTQSARTMGVLCQEGAIPVLALLLQSSNYEVQFYSCSALSNIATVPGHHPKMFGIGDRFLLKSLLTLMSSSVQKNASQACRCLQILSGNVVTQEQLMYLNCVLPLKALLCSATPPLTESAIALLSELATHQPNREGLVNEGLVQVIGQLLLCHRSSSIINHSVVTITNLSSTSEGQQAVMDSECVTGLLKALVSSVTSEETVLCVTSCLHHLTSWDLLQSHLATKMTPEHVSSLVKFSAQMDNLELSYRSASIISKLKMNEHVIQLLTPQYAAISEYLLMYLKNQEVRFQQLSIVTLCNLKKDREFSVLMSDSVLEKQLKWVHAQTEQTRQLLQAIQMPPSS
ncbi:uncharacterized protein LOC118368075 [Oncorhynchus keta]|uniref:uncharacterized protein LOC118368075 n=1 Tax=Oncorhynchus keta TaxID=8018 RepID=UPI0015FE67BA|nr:uncharacterized protein LOC118368075 [Oncorhynchus keta]